MTAPAHIFTSYVGPTPVLYPATPEPAWYHVTCVQAYQPGTTHAPCSVALTREALPGGRLDPGSSVSLFGDAVWVVGPTDGQPAVVSIERRLAPSFTSVSPMGERLNITAWKSSAMGIRLTPGKWFTPWSNILGMVSGIVRCSGGPAWIGTHVDTRQPPPPTEAAMATSGGCFPIYPTDPPLQIEGNPMLVAFTFASGVTLHLLKVERGRFFGGG